MQGIALYRHEIQKLDKEQVVYVQNEIKKDHTQVENDNEIKDETQIAYSSSEALVDPNVIDRKIAENINIIFEEFQPEEMLAVDESLENESFVEPVVEETAAIEEEKENLIAFSNPLKSEENEGNDLGIVVYDYSKKSEKKKEVKKSSTKDLESLLAMTTENKVKKSNPNLHMAEIEFQAITSEEYTMNANTIELTSIVSKNFVPIDSSGYGVIEKKVEEENFKEEFDVYAPEMMPMSLTAKWSVKEKIINRVPFINQQRISEWYEYFGLKGELGLVLLQINNEVDYFELKSHEAIVFLDSDLNESEEQFAEYVMYLGVQPGFQDLIIKSGNSTINIPIFVRENYIRYKEVRLDSGNIKMFSTYENLPMTKDPKMLMLSEQDIMSITSEGLITKETLNTFQLKSTLTAEGEGEKIALKYGNQEYIVELNKREQKITLPSEEYINQILETSVEVNPSCIVEIIHNKPADFIELKFIALKSELVKGAENIFTQEEEITERHLDEDGIFYPSNSVKTKKSYYLLEYPGQLFIKTTYQDGTEANENIHCGPKEFHQRVSGE